MSIKLGLGGLCIAFILVCALATGYVMNIVKFVRLDFEQPVKAEILRGIGIFPPIGAVMGWVPIKDGKVIEVVK